MVSSSEQEITDLHRVFKVLGNGGRLQVFLYLKYSGVATGSIIAKNLGLSRSVVSRHLKDLASVNLVLREKWFRTTVFKANPETMEGVMQQVAH